MEHIKINVTEIYRTDQAILVNDGKRQAWVPLSQIQEEIQKPKGPLNLLTTTAIIVADWVAKEKGLQQIAQDEDTKDMFGDPA